MCIVNLLRNMGGAGQADDAFRWFKIMLLTVMVDLGRIPTCHFDTDLRKVLQRNIQKISLCRQGIVQRQALYKIQI